MRVVPFFLLAACDLDVLNQVLSEVCDESAGECLSFTAFAENIESELGTGIVGYGYGVGRDGLLVASGAYGDRRTGSDGVSAFTTYYPQEGASTSKTITAIAAMKALSDAGVDVDDAIAPWLPSSWALGPNVDTMTFRELLTHTAGIRVAYQPNDYAGVRDALALGVDLDDRGVAQYSNTNFAVFRMLIPALDGWTEADGSDPATDYAIAYRDYVIDNVFAPALHPDVGVTPQPDSTLYYPAPPVDVPGYLPGDSLLTAAAQGWQISVEDLLAVISFWELGTILPETQVQQMKDQLLGCYAGSARNATYYTHNGAEYWGVADGLTAEDHTVWYAFDNGVQVVVFANSPAQVEAAVLNAWEASWTAEP